jgi:hypothetical protein
MARLATEWGYVWKWWSGPVKQVREGPNRIVLLLLVGDRVVPVDVRIVSQQGRHVGRKPDLHQEMLDEAERRFADAGIDIHQFKVSGDSAFWNGWAADLGAAMRVGGVCRGPGTDRFESGGGRQTATQWKREFASRLAKGWGGEEEVSRVEATSPTFGKGIWVFYRPREGQERIEYLIVVGRPLRACEALRVQQAPHWIEEFWQILRSVLHVEAIALRGRSGALAGIGIEGRAYLLLEEVPHGLKKMRRFSQLTLHQLVPVCPRFVDMRAFLREHFHDRIPANYGLDQALART